MKTNCYGRKAEFKIIFCNEKLMIIADVGDKYNPTVTNRADEVVEILHKHLSLKDRILFYMDKMGNIDEMIHDSHGKFLKFSVGPRGYNKIRENTKIKLKQLILSFAILSVRLCETKGVNNTEFDDLHRAIEELLNSLGCTDRVCCAFRDRSFEMLV